jgi:antirestriction protein ArdC
MGKVSEETVMPSQTEIRDEVTQRIVQALESNLFPWRRPWRATEGGPQPGRHSNVASKRPYQGANPLLLECHALQHCFSSRWWGTFPMWKSLGCNIKKRPPNVEEGHWGCRVVFWKPLTKKVIDEQTGDEEDERFFVLRTYVLFNADQVEGEAAAGLQVHEEEGQPHAQPDFQPAEELMAATGADIRHGGERAFYNMAADYVQLPHRERFGSLGAYYETAIHELAHWSEPRQQLDRPQLGYAMCELVAEMAACFVASEIGVPHGEALENHASYLKSWLDGMKGDRTFVFRAAKLASRTTDFLLDFVKQPEPEAVGVVT